MKQFLVALAAVLMTIGAATSSPAEAQSNEDLANLAKCVGYEACKAIQDKIDSIRNGAGKIATTVSNTVSPNDDRSYFDKFSLEERQQAMETCEKNYAGRNCEVSYLTPEEIAARHPKAKPAPPLSPEVERAREREQLGRLDKSVADVLDVKCFTPEMANGANYGDCADALTQLNGLEKQAKAIGLPLRASALAEQFGFPRNADGTWNDRYTRVGEPQQPARAGATAAAPRTPSGTRGKRRDGDYAALLAKCQLILTCSTENLETIVSESDSLRQEACGGTACSDGNLKLMTQIEKELLAKGNLARAELDARKGPKQLASATKLDPDADPTQQLREVCNGKKYDQMVTACSALIQSGVDLPYSYANRCRAYAFLHQGELGVPDCTRAIALKPDFAEAYINRARAYGDSDIQNNLGLAIADLDFAISLNPTSGAYFLRGTYKFYGQRPDLAIADFRMSLQLDPNNKQAANWLAKLSPAPAVTEPDDQGSEMAGPGGN